MGGCGAFKCAIARPDLYSSALIMSGSILSKRELRHIPLSKGMMMIEKISVMNSEVKDGRLVYSAVIE